MEPQTKHAYFDMHVQGLQIPVGHSCTPLLEDTYCAVLLGALLLFALSLRPPNVPGLLVEALLAAGVQGSAPIASRAEIAKATLMAHAPYWAGKICCPAMALE